MQLNLLVVLALLFAAAFASAEVDARKLANCSPHPKMTKSECHACKTWGVKVHWIGTGRKGKGGCQYDATSAPSTSK